GLEAISYPARNKDGLIRFNFGMHQLAVGCRTFAEIAPRTKYLAVGDGDQLIPGLRVQTAGNSGGGVKGQVVLHGSKVRQAGLAHGGSLPIFFELASVINVNIEFDNAQTIDIGGFNVLAETAFLC